MKMTRRKLVAGAVMAGLAVAVGSFAMAQTRYATVPTQITIKATPIVSFDGRDPERSRFGALEFRGGLVLSSNFEPFGGISGLYMKPDGSAFTAVTDRGSWLRARIVYRDGKPEALANVEMAPVLGADGKPLAAGKSYDTEALTEMNGKFFIGIERAHQVVRLDVKEGFAARAVQVPVPSDFKSLPNNRSLECVAAVPPAAPLAGKLIAIPEKSLDNDGNLQAFVLDPQAKPGAVDAATMRFSVKRTDDFDVSDCTVLPPGDLLLLERRFSPARGVALRIRRVPLNAIKQGALVDGVALIDADLAYQIDNMEGMALHKNAAGETVITLVSDDNFSIIQRNLLLQFVLVDP